jgi:hypothetical protein
MDHRDILGGIVSPEAFLADHGICSTRRGLLVAPLLAALSLALSDEAAIAGTINPSETQITLPGAIKWDDWVAGLPSHSGEMAALYRVLARLRWTAKSPCVLRDLAASYRLANLKTLELGVIQIQRLVIPCPTMRSTERL